MVFFLSHLANAAAMEVPLLSIAARTSIFVDKREQKKGEGEEEEEKS